MIIYFVGICMSIMDVNLHGYKRNLLNIDLSAVDIHEFDKDKFNQFMNGLLDNFKSKGYYLNYLNGNKGYNNSSHLKFNENDCLNTKHIENGIVINYTFEFDIERYTNESGAFGFSILTDYDGSLSVIDSNESVMNISSYRGFYLDYSYVVVSGDNSCDSIISRLEKSHSNFLTFNEAMFALGLGSGILYRDEGKWVELKRDNELSLYELSARHFKTKQKFIVMNGEIVDVFDFQNLINDIGWDINFIEMLN